MAIIYVLRLSLSSVIKLIREKIHVNVLQNNLKLDLFISKETQICVRLLKQIKHRASISNAIHERLLCYAKVRENV